MPPISTDQQIPSQVEGLGDAAWWTVHVELPNIHVNTDNGVLDVVAEPFQFRIAFRQIPNPAGVDKSAWLADATELANDVLAVLGR